MKSFSKLAVALDSTRDPVGLLSKSLQSASASDQKWITHLLSGKSFPAIYSLDDLENAMLARTQLPLWLWERSKIETADRLEACALLLEVDSPRSDVTLTEFIETKIVPWTRQFPPPSLSELLDQTAGMEALELSLVFKWICGQWKSPVLESTVRQATGSLPVAPPQKLAPPTHTLKAVLLYVERGYSGIGALTVGIHSGNPQEIPNWVPITQVQEDALTEKEADELARWIQKNRLEKFGPVQSVHPVQVFEIGFTGIESAPRKKAKIALKEPRILTWKKNALLQEVSSLEDLYELQS